MSDSVVMMICFLKLGVSKCNKGKEKSDSLLNKFQINRTKDTHTNQTRSNALIRYRRIVTVINRKTSSANLGEYPHN